MIFERGDGNLRHQSSLLNYGKKIADGSGRPRWRRDPAVIAGLSSGWKDEEEMA